MNDRKQHVIDTAHKLFIEKGYQATSIQDILNGSGISKGTFYNYFPSKGELFMAIFRYYYQELRQKREKLLVGRDPSEVDVFLQQMELQLRSNKQSSLHTLIEEILVSNDEELKSFIKRIQLLNLRWIYNRFLDMFEKKQHLYLLDMAILFQGMTIHMLHFNFFAKDYGAEEGKIIRYCMDRIITLIADVSEHDKHILDPQKIDAWLPNFRSKQQKCHNDLMQAVLGFKKAINRVLPRLNDRSNANEIIDFIQDEATSAENGGPRIHLIESLLRTLEAQYQAYAPEEYKCFKENITICIQQQKTEV